MLTSAVPRRLRLVLPILATGLLASMWAPPATAISERTLFSPTGFQSIGFLGGSVGTAGDMNGDGYSDVIVGAHLADPFPTDVGSALVYFGGPSADASADLFLHGQASGDTQGRSVGTAGDVNGDGFADVIVGAPRNDAGGVDAGRAYVYYGGRVPNSTADLILTGAAAGDEFGRSVGTAGDVNGDGYADVIVGAYQNDTGGGNAGRAYVYYGGPTADATADLTFTGAAVGDVFGFSVGTAGDVNGDGYADVIVGGSSNDAGGVDAGRAYVYYGGPSADGTADIVFTGAAGSDFFGYSVGTAGDVNGDGYDDVIIGATDNDAGGSNAGRAYVCFGGPLADVSADLVFTGEAVANAFGISVGAAGDVNADGYADVVVGAAGNDANGVDAGSMSVFFGGPSADAVADVTIRGAEPGDEFGISVGTAGDVDGDGVADLIAGAWRSDASAFVGGRAHVISLYSYKVLSPNGGERWVAGRQATVRWSGHDVADLSISLDGGATWDVLASGVGGLDDNQATVDVPSIATEFAKVRLSYKGQPVSRSSSDASDGVFSVVLPERVPAATWRLDLTPTGAAANDVLGYAVGTAGDFNGDGYDDVIVGAHLNDAGGADAGRAYVVYGGPTADDIPDLTLTGEAAGDFFGSALGTAGDVNGDGFDDVIVGAYGNDTGAADAGRAYVYYGGASPDAVADLTLTDIFPNPNDQLGFSVGAAGDINGDGYDDVIVGVYLDDGNGTNAGLAYIYFGGPFADPFSDNDVWGAAADDTFGQAVGTAGDVNGDGYDDIIVGAPNNDAGGVNAGRAYLYYGSESGVFSAGEVFTGEATGDLFGYDVGTAGDVNGDGYDDLIVSAPLNDAGIGDAGRTYVYHGGPSIDAVADLVVSGVGFDDRFGISAGTAGDVNRDGYDDVIVGAPFSDADGANGGRAIVYYGGRVGDAVADFTLTGAAAGDNFGVSVGTAGDVDGDGHADLIVGARFHDAGGTDAGRANVYNCNRYFMLSPSGGETWNVGASKSVMWSGAEPADVWLSVDGGSEYELLRRGVGGDETNTVQLRVPHTPTLFARVKVTPSDTGIGGSHESDSFFTIQSSVSLLSLAAERVPDGGAEVRWSSDPGVGPEGLAGYRLYRDDTRIGPELILEERYLDASAAPGSRYRLIAVNGLDEELELGEVTFAASLVGLRMWPSPLGSRDALNVEFAAPVAAPGFPATDLDVGIFDTGGRRVATLARGVIPAPDGVIALRWESRDRAIPASAGVYFVRVSAPSAGYRAEGKLLVIR